MEKNPDGIKYEEWQRWKKLKSEYEYRRDTVSTFLFITVYQTIALFALISGLALVWWFYFLFIIGCLIVLLGSYFSFLKVKKEFKSSTKEEYKLLP
tara:strand:- start:94 stop:381 length:288 start_codon:yes stop_codon:yes gene_type:complete